MSTHHTSLSALLVMTVALGASAVACGGSTGAPDVIALCESRNEALPATIGEALVLRAEVQRASSASIVASCSREAITPDKVSTSTPELIEVSREGSAVVIRAKAAGEAKLSFEAEGLKGSATIQVAPINSVALTVGAGEASDAELPVLLDSTLALHARPVDASGEVLAGAPEGAWRVDPADAATLVENPSIPWAPTLTVSNTATTFTITAPHGSTHTLRAVGLGDVADVRVQQLGDDTFTSEGKTMSRERSKADGEEEDTFILLYSLADAQGAVIQGVPTTAPTFELVPVDGAQDAQGMTVEALPQSTAEAAGTLGAVVSTTRAGEAKVRITLGARVAEHTLEATAKP